MNTDLEQPTDEQLLAWVKCVHGAEAKRRCQNIIDNGGSLNDESLEGVLAAYYEEKEATRKERTELRFLSRPVKQSIKRQKHS